MRKLDDVMEEHWTKNFPRAIQIETDSRCNSKCNYCPYTETSKRFGHSKMNEELFLKILRELAEFKPQVIAPYMNNEPLIDKEIFRRMKLVRKALPNVFIDFSTNGSLLTQAMSEQLLDAEIGVNEIKINFPSIDQAEYERITRMNYQRTVTNIIQFVGMAGRINFQGRYRIIMVGASEPVEATEFWENRGIVAKVYPKLSRGGAIETDMEVRGEVFGCKYNREKEWLHILSSGDIILCCMDWYREHNLGNVQDISISQIWNDREYSALREKVQYSTDKDFICNKCEWGLPHKKQ